MRHLARFLLQLATAASLVLLVAAAALGWRGRWTGDDVMITHTSAGGPPWRSAFVQGWHSGGGLRIYVQMSRSTAALPPSPYGPYAPGWTPFGMQGWHFSDTLYLPNPYPFDTFAANAFKWGGFQGFAADRASAGSSERSWSLTMPTWFAWLALAALPTVRATAAVRRFRRATQAARGGPRCCACGYDLRATPDQCPECGADPPSGTKTTARPPIHWPAMSGAGAI